MNENNEIIEENINTGAEDVSGVPEDVPEETENILENPEDMKTDDSLENEDSEVSENLYDMLVNDITDKLKENPVDESGDIDLSDSASDSDLETVDITPEIPSVYQVYDVSSNDIPVSDILDYLKEQEINTSLGMPFSEANLSDLTVTDGLLLIVLILFLFRWLFDFGRSLF